MVPRAAIFATLLAVSTAALGAAPPGVDPLSPVAQWFGRQFNSANLYCCNAADGHVYYGAYTLNADESVTLPAPMGGTLTVEAWKVLQFNPKDPNPTGQAVIWYSGTLTADLTSNVYCFAIGPLT